MRGGLGILTLIIALAALKAALMVILAAFGVMLLCCLIARPRETVVLTLTIGLLAVASAHPVPLAFAIGVVGVVGAMRRSKATAAASRRLRRSGDVDDEQPTISAVLRN